MSDSEEVFYRALSELVSQVDAKITVRKDPTQPYVGLEHIPSRGAHLTGWSQASSSISTNSIFQAGDVLFGKLRPNLRKCVVAPFNGYCSTDILILRSNTGFDPSFAGKVLRTDQVGGAAEMTSVGTKMPRTSWKNLSELVVFCPGFPEQSKIAKVLDTLDTAIHETEAIIVKLKAVKQGLLHDLLTRGIDADGELRPPQNEGPHLYKQSPLGWIPKEWDAVTLSACSLKIADRDHTTPRYIEDGVLIISPTNLQGDEGIDFVSSKRISRRAHEINCKKTDLAPGDIILHRIGAGLGRVRLVAAEMPEFSILHSMAQIRPNLNAMTSHFMLWAMRSESTKSQMGLGTQSIGVPDLGLDKISNFIMPKPPLEEQRQIAARLVALQTRIDADSNDCTKLATLKSGLMDDLLTGRVRVTPLLEAAP